MEYLEKYENIGFTNNFAFCKVMQNEEICREVIETLLHINVGRLEYKSFERDMKLEIGKRGIRLDVYVAGSNRVFDLEMQTTSSRNLGCRMRYYQAMIDAELLENGADFGDLKESSIIFFCTFDPFRRGLPQYTFHHCCEELPELKLDDKCQKIVYNVNAFEKVGDERARKLLEFISTGRSETPLTDKICKELRRVQGNEEWRVEYMTLQMFEKETYNFGFTAGEERGISLGAREAKLETAKKFLAMGLPAEQVADGTGLSLEEIEKL